MTTRNVSTENKPKGRIAGLDGFRAIAVSAVFLHHSLAPPGVFGALGVWMFFVLSGFLVLPIAQKGIDRRPTGALKERVGAVARFSFNRFLRIFPIYYGLLALLGLVALTGATFKPIPGYIAGAKYFWTYTTNFYIAARNDFIDVFTHLWSLAIEFQFYVIVAVLIFVIPRGTFRPLVAVLYVACLAWTAKLVAGGDSAAVYVNSIIGFGMMLLGGLTAFALNHRPFADRLRKISMPLVALALLVGTHLALNLAGFHGATYFVTPLLSALTIAMIALKPEALGFLEWRPLREMGVFSYGFYLYHLFIIATFRIAFDKIADLSGIEYVSVLYVPAAFFATIAVSMASWYWFEKKILAYKMGQSVPVSSREAPARDLVAATTD